MFTNKLLQQIFSQIGSILQLLKERFERLELDNSQKSRLVKIHGIIAFVIKALTDLIKNIVQKYEQAISGYKFSSLESHDQQSQLPQAQQSVWSQKTSQIYSQILTMMSLIRQINSKQEQKGFSKQLEVCNFAQRIVTKIYKSSQRDNIVKNFIQSIVSDFFQDGSKGKSIISSLNFLPSQNQDFLEQANIIEDEKFLNQSIQDIMMQNKQIELELSESSLSAGNHGQRKLKQKQEGQKQQLQENIQLSEQQKLIRILYKQIIHIQQEYMQIYTTFSKHQKNELWFFQLKNEEIKQIVMKKIKLNPLKLQNEIKQWKKYLQKRSWKFDQICYTHKIKIYYSCLNQSIKERMYLCNQCIQDQESALKHKNHQLVCIRHKEPIKYKCSPNEVQFMTQIQTTEPQYFLCQRCLYLCREKYTAICCQHYDKLISEVCIEPKCIQMDDFKLCRACQSSKNNHKNHRVISYKHQQLMNVFGLHEILNIKKYENQLMKAQGMIRLNLIEKVKLLYIEQILPTIRFLDSLAVLENKEVQKQVKLFIDVGKKEDLMVLVGLLKMKQGNKSEEYILAYLEAFNCLMQQQFQEALKLTSDKIHDCGKRIGLLCNISQEQIAAQLGKKYRQIIQIENNHKVIVSPMMLSEVDPLHHNLIQKIIVIKDYEQLNHQKIVRVWKRQRGRFFMTGIQNKLSQKVQGNQQKQIIQLFIETKQKYSYGLAFKLFQQQKLKKYKPIIESLKSSYKKMNQQFQAKLKECFPWKIITQNQFINLKCIHIQFTRFKYYLKRKQDSITTIDAFKLFQFIHGNPQLQSVTIKGVLIQKITEFIKQLNKIDKAGWMRNFKPSQGLRLALDIKYEFHPSLNKQFNYLTFLSRIEDLMNFRKHFRWLSQMTIKIIFKGDSWMSHLDKLLLCIRGIKKIKIDIDRMERLLLKQLLDGLSHFFASFSQYIIWT